MRLSPESYLLGKFYIENHRRHTFYCKSCIKYSLYLNENCSCKVHISSSMNVKIIMRLSKIGSAKTTGYRIWSSTHKPIQCIQCFFFRRVIFLFSLFLYEKILNIQSVGVNSFKTGTHNGETTKSTMTF